MNIEERIGRANKLIDEHGLAGVLPNGECWASAPFDSAGFTCFGADKDEARANLVKRLASIIEGEPSKETPVLNDKVTVDRDNLITMHSDAMNVLREIENAEQVFSTHENKYPAFLLAKNTANKVINSLRDMAVLDSPADNSMTGLDNLICVINGTLDRIERVNASLLTIQSAVNNLNLDNQRDILHDSKKQLRDAMLAVQAVPDVGQRVVEPE